VAFHGGLTDSLTMTTILVTGGSGTLGRAVVARLLAVGVTARVLSRTPRQDPGVEWVTGDLTTGVGLDGAVRGVDAVIHCATDVRKTRNDLAAAGNLIAAVRRAGGPHLVYISIVGVDRVPLGYYKVKLEVEGLVEGSGLPWTVLRATQFHDLVRTVARVASRLPVAFAPAGTRFQPVDVRDVAARLVDLAVAAPAGRVPDFGGPEVLPATDLVHAYLRATGRQRRVLPIRLPGKVARGYRDGGHLVPEHADGRRTFAEFLAEKG
jgi:uncharacterized protein YbjT (DUF2867 family)